MLLPETDIVGAFVVAEKIRGGAEEVGLVMAGPEPVTSVSIGLVSHPEDGHSAEELMTAADRAMYQAKRLGKNQISGNPRPRPALLARRSAVEAPAPQATINVPPTESQPAEERRPEPASTVTAPHQDRAVAVELGPIPVGEPEPDRRHDEEDDADPEEVRRRIASASRSFDPDHQIRRAMDAFLSPGASEREHKTPDH